MSKIALKIWQKLDQGATHFPLVEKGIAVAWKGLARGGWPEEPQATRAAAPEQRPTQLTRVFIPLRRTTKNYLCLLEKWKSLNLSREKQIFRNPENWIQQGYSGIFQTIQVLILNLASPTSPSPHQLPPPSTSPWPHRHKRSSVWMINSEFP